MPPTVALDMLGRAVLAGVFLIAGTAKLFGSDSSDLAATFGFRSGLARRAGQVLPLVELSVGAALVWPATTPLGAWLALLLLAGFTVIVVRAIRRGESHACNCFGAVSAAPIGPRTVWRNGGLLSVALLVTAATSTAVAPGPSLLAWINGGFATEFLALCCMVLMVGMVGTTRTIRRMDAAHRSLTAVVEELEQALDQRPSKTRTANVPDAGLPIGAPAPHLASRTPDGTLIHLSDLLALNHPVLLFYLGADCAACKPLYPHIRDWAREARRRVTLAVLFTGSRGAETFGDDVIVLTEDVARQAASFRLSWMPSAVLITRSGTVGSPAAVGADAVVSLVTPLVVSDTPESAVPASLVGDRFVGLPIGSAGPDSVTVPGHGERTLVFWQASCSYCKALYPELRRWVDDRGADASSLVIVNWGHEPIPGIDDLLCVDDPGGTLARHHGVKGTPSALRIDGNGRVASSVGIGARDVMALLGSPAVTAT